VSNGDRDLIQCPILKGLEPDDPATGQIHDPRQDFEDEIPNKVDVILDSHTIPNPFTVMIKSGSQSQQGSQYKCNLNLFIYS